METSDLPGCAENIRAMLKRVTPSAEVKHLEYLGSL
jgi:hypothetical protein